MSKAAERQVEALADELFEHVNRFFPPVKSHEQEAKCDHIALTALMNCIANILFEQECDDCRRASTRYTRKMLKMVLRDIEHVRTEVLPSLELH